MPLDNPDANFGTNPEANSNLNSEVAALKNQVFSLLVALVVVTGSFTIYLYRQDSMLGKDCAQFSTALASVNQNRASINNFVYNLMIYGQKHPEFTQAVLKKYGIAPPAAGSLPPPNTPIK